MDESVFYGCSGFEELTVPGFLREVPAGSFVGCFGIKKLTISEGVKGLGNNAFSGCRNLTELVTPSTMKHMDAGSFEGCGKLQNVVLNDGLEYLGSTCFARCSGITNIRIPESLKEIGASTFEHCTGIADEQGMIIQNRTLYGYIGERSEPELSHGVERLVGGCFAGNRKLRKLEIPPYIVDIGPGAFRECEHLEELQILSHKVKSLGKEPFRGCRRLISLTVIGMVPEDFEENDVRIAAALGFCKDYKLFRNREAGEYDIYIKNKRQYLMQIAVDNSLLNVMKYFTDYKLFDKDIFDGILEYAQQKKAMEIVALLLKYRGEDNRITAFDKYEL